MSAPRRKRADGLDHAVTLLPMMTCQTAALRCQQSWCSMVSPLVRRASPVQAAAAPFFYITPKIFKNLIDKYNSRNAPIESMAPIGEALPAANDRAARPVAWVLRLWTLLMAVLATAATTMVTNASGGAGNSPVMIHKAQLEEVCPIWYDLVSAYLTKQAPTFV